MISIIICSKQIKYKDNLLSNIAETIGCDHEVIIIDNSRNDYSICQAYNLGIKRAKGNILCFMHADVSFCTLGWGNRVKRHLADKTIGLIGVAGNHFAPRLPQAYWSSATTSVNISQNNKIWKQEFVSPSQGVSDVVMVDGVWMCARRELFEKISFDDLNFTGFHCYDSDLSMQVHLLGLRVCVVFDILLNHDSLGSKNKEWIVSIFTWYKKWNGFLPMETMDFTPEKKRVHSFEVAREVKQAIIANGMCRRFFPAMFWEYMKTSESRLKDILKLLFA